MCQGSEKFLKTLHAIEPAYANRLQLELEQNGVFKRLLSFNYTDAHNEPASSGSSSSSSSNSSGNNSLRQIIVDMIDTECHTLINWVRLMPDFNALSIADQTSSLELNFLEVILVEYIWRTMKNNSNSSSSSTSIGGLKFYLHAQLALQRAAFLELGMCDVFDHLASIVEKLTRMGLTEDEYLCLKALTLFKSDFSFSDVEKLEQCRHMCLQSLKMSRSTAAANSSAYRFESLLMLLSDLKAISIRLAQEMYMFYAEHHVELPTLLYNMLDQSHSLFGLCALRNRQRIHLAASGSGGAMIQQQYEIENYDMIDEEEEQEEEEEEEEEGGEEGDEEEEEENEEKRVEPLKLEKSLQV